MIGVEKVNHELLVVTLIKSLFLKTDPEGSNFTVEIIYN
jgi:hypothetical protein